MQGNELCVQPCNDNPLQGRFGSDIRENVFTNFCKEGLSNTGIEYQGDSRGGVTIPTSVQKRVNVARGNRV